MANTNVYGHGTISDCLIVNKSYLSPDVPHAWTSTIISTLDC